MAKNKSGGEEVYSFAELALEMAGSEWGLRAASRDDAIAGLSEAGGAQAALLLLIRRFQQAVDAWGEDREPRADTRTRLRGRPKDAVAYPHAHLGQVLFGCGPDGEYGPYAAVVAHQDHEGYIRVANVLPPDEYAQAIADDDWNADCLYMQWAGTAQPLFATWQEAVRWRAALMRDRAARVTQMANAMDAAIDAGNTMQQLDEFITDSDSWFYPLPGDPPRAHEED